MEIITSREIIVASATIVFVMYDEK
jgi:hypothetical protein